MGAAHQALFLLTGKVLGGAEPALETVFLVAGKFKDDHLACLVCGGTKQWSVVPGTGLEPVSLAAADFKSAVYTNFTTRADGKAGL